MTSESSWEDKLVAALDASAEKYAEQPQPTISDCIQNAKEWLDTAITMQMQEYISYGETIRDELDHRPQPALDTLQQMIRVRQLMRGLS